MLTGFYRTLRGKSVDVTAHGPMRAFIARAMAQIQGQVGDERVLCAVSGGVDSMVLATLLHKAIGDALVPVFVDNGLLRKNEAAEVVATCKELGIPLVAVDAVDPFLSALAGVTDPENETKGDWCTIH